MKVKIYPIIPGKLYQSAKTHELTIVEKTTLIEAYNLSTIVNLWHTLDDELCILIGADNYIHQYFPDGKTPVYDKMKKLAEQLCTEITAGRVVLVHCWGGRNRSGLLNAMILMKLWHMNGKEALDYIRLQRPNSLANKHFAKWLEEQI